MTASQVGRLAERTGRWVLLGAVAFWWGVIVAPRLVSLAFPDLLPPDAIPRHLDPEEERMVANGVSAAALLTVGLLALANARRSLDRLTTQNERICALGWTALGVTGAYLAWEEISEFHLRGTRDLGDVVLGSSNLPWFWPVVLSPAIVAFLIAMAVFIHRGLRAKEVRVPLILGLAAWLLAVLFEVSYPVTGAGRLTVLFEETMEFGGSLLIALSAGLALGSLSRPRNDEAGRREASDIFSVRHLTRLAIWSMAAVTVLAVIAAVVYRGPLADSRARVHIGAFYVSLPDSQTEEHSLVQELGVLDAPVARLRLRVANSDSLGRSGTMLWRVMEEGEGGSGPLVREGRVEVTAREHPKWVNIDFPPLEYAEGRRLLLQLVAEVVPGSHLRVGATKTNRFPEGWLWINGAPTWPDQNIEFAAYMAAEPTLGKLRTMWNTFTSDWRWPVMAVEAAIGMAVVIFIPALLVTAALRRRDLR
ncbi:MAG: hypothetical protein OXG46_05840 [Chloroflexi bacterium]|nr:hypothetical protein [Chloroflexota bacterium]MCY3937863.1 hypothetical protein [Chloroflexota bacterium]